MRDEHLVDLELFAATTLYAGFLDAHKELWEPDFTWAEVAIGCALCLGAATLRTRMQPLPGWRDHERNVWLAFAIGGTPIIVWRLIRMFTMKQARIDYQENRDVHTPEALASEG
jgi:hypothetical protein